MEFYRMKKAEESSRFPDANTVTYVVSTAWIERYKEYIFWSCIASNQAPAPTPGHLEKKHPGKVGNYEILNHGEKYLKGTGTIKGFETEVVDTYLINDREKFEFWSEELWNFVMQRYGCDHVIKRFYVKMNAAYSLTEVEWRYKEVPVCIVKAEDLYAGKCSGENFNVQIISMSKRATYSDFKRRVVDIMAAQGLSGLKIDDVRLWQCSKK